MSAYRNTYNNKTKYMQPKARFCTDWRRALLFLLGERVCRTCVRFLLKTVLTVVKGATTIVCGRKRQRCGVLCPDFFEEKPNSKMRIGAIFG